MSDQIIMTTKELAKYLKLNEKTIIKMAQQKEIPGVKVGNQWRFHRSVIDAYLKQNLAGVSDKDMNRVNYRQESNIFLSRLICPRAIDLGAEIADKNAVLSRLVELAYKAEITKAPDKLLEELKKREEMLSTAVGNLTALPHPRHPGTELFSQEGIVIIRTNKALEFNAPDKKAVRLFIMICALDEARHLQILAAVAKFLQHQSAVEALMSVNNADDLMRYLLGFDRNNNFTIEM
ncbi:MAG: PTS sugar transporter subunit IIA [Candidatus Omnitrophica bacterium]|nr:PTS sugar transporter subunit IIA [Candidatus Omnitrophota bacterium]